MEPDEMKRLYLEHREVEEARDLDAAVATFDEDCFLENVALGTRAAGRDAVRSSYEALFGAFPDLSPTSVGEAYGDDVFVTWGTVHGTMDGPWLGIEPTHNSFTCAFVNVVPFRNGKMQHEQLFFDLPALCRWRRRLDRRGAQASRCRTTAVAGVAQSGANDGPPRTNPTVDPPQ